MGNQIYIRADGDAQIGLGHLVRCLALAQHLRHDFNICFIIKSAPNHFIDELDRLGFSYVKILAESDLVDLLTENCIVVVDHYNLNSEYQREIKERGCKLVCIDDMHQGPFYADLIINHSLGVREEQYETLNDSRFALGPRFVLVRPEFLKDIQYQKSITEVNTIFICFGGSDSQNLTTSTLKILLANGGYKRLLVVTGPLFTHLPLVEALAAKSEKIEIYQSLSAARMSELMQASDLAIVPSSGVLMEAMSVRLPAITGYYVENQREAANQYHQAGMAYCVGSFLTDYEKNLTKALDSLSVSDLNMMVDKQNEHMGDVAANLQKVFRQLDEMQ